MCLQSGTLAGEPQHPTLISCRCGAAAGSCERRAVLTRMAGTAVGVLVARPIIEAMLAASLADICTLLSVDTLTFSTRWYT